MYGMEGHSDGRTDYHDVVIVVIVVVVFVFVLVNIVSISSVISTH